MKYLFIVIIFFSTSCAKEKSCENCVDNTSPYKNATIIYAGPLVSDGCGWLVKIDDTHTYHPDVLNPAFEQDQLPVKIDYELTSDKFICGISSLQIPVIHVKDIKL